MYYCYLSRVKIDNLYESIEKRVLIDEREISSSKSALQGSFSFSNLVGKVKASADLADVQQHEKKLRQTYINKLDRILEELREMPEISIVMDKYSNLSGRYYTYEGKFQVKGDVIIDNKIAEDIVSIESTFYTSKGDKYHIILDCSSKYFGDATNNGEYFIHSSNYRFFQDHLPIWFRVIFMVVGMKENTIYGSPICIILDDDYTII